MPPINPADVCRRCESDTDVDVDDNGLPICAVCLDDDADDADQWKDEPIDEF